MIKQEPEHIRGVTAQPIWLQVTYQGYNTYEFMVMLLPDAKHYVLSTLTRQNLLGSTLPVFSVDYTLEPTNLGTLSGIQAAINKMPHMQFMNMLATGVWR